MNEWHRRVRVLVVLLVMIMAGCASQAQPFVPPTIPPAQADRPEPSGITSPPAFDGSFWWADKPTQLKPVAFGKVVPVGAGFLISADGTPRDFSIGRFTLATSLPKASAALPVYMTGVYAPSHKFNGPPVWEFAPQYALVWNHHLQEAPPGPDLATRAATLLELYDLLMPDSRDPKTIPLPDGSTLVVFFRHVDGMPVYGDKPACVNFDAQGRVTSIDIRRRPLLEMSLYPTRTPEQAWEALQRGQYLKPGSLCQDGSNSVLAGKVPEFRVTSVALAYWEHHVDRSRQTMIPYYVFRSAEGTALYVPAIAPEWVKPG